MFEEQIIKEDILYIKTKAIKQRAKSISDEEGCGIFFNEKAFPTHAERLVSLAHEKAHCDTGEFYRIDTPYRTRARCEYKAWRRTVLDLVPYDLLVEAVVACKTSEGVDIYALAEHLDVTPEFTMLR